MDAKFLNRIYYNLKPFIPKRLQISLRRKLVLRKVPRTKDIWPIDEKANKPPDAWPGWPDQKQFALVLTHDVDTAYGQKKCDKLMQLEIELGFRSSFNFVPKRYEVSSELLTSLRENGFEIAVHGLYHDGKLYNSKKLFQERAIHINHYLKKWNAVGFRSPAMHHNLDWIHDLHIQYDASTFDTDPFEPQSDGLRTIFPFWVQENCSQEGYVELPYTLPQDFTLFVLLKERNIDIWKRKLDWIVEKGGMALLITHPDYMSFGNHKLQIEEYPSQYYREFLEHFKCKYEGQYLHLLPKDMARFWSRNYSKKSTRR